MPDMLAHALAYLAKGWSVLPCAPKAKHPRVNWLEYQTRHPTEAEVRSWWARWPDAGIALITGRTSSVVVVDIDGRKGGSLSGHPPTALMAKTPDGYHLFYSQPVTAVASGADIMSPHGPTDVRGEGGIVMLPPTKHKSGTRYDWAVKEKPSSAPAWLLTHSATRATVPEKRESGANWIADALAGNVVEGARNDTAARLTGFFAGKGLSVDIVLATLLAWNAKLSAPLDVRELTTTVESVCRTARDRNPLQAQPQPTGSEPAKPQGFGLKPYGAYMKEHAAWETRWLFDKWLPDETIAMMVAAPGSFKTWIEFDLAVSLAGGFPFLGNEPGRTGPVIMVQQEDAPGDIVDRISTMHFVKAGIAKPKLYKDGTIVVELPNDIPIFFHEAARLKFDDADVMEAFRKQIETIRPVACFIDPLYSAANAESYMSESVQKMMALKRWRTEYKTSFVLAHHTNKSGTTSRSRQRAWGSQFLNGFLETGLQVHRPDENAEWVVVERHTKSDGPLGAVKINYDINTGPDWRYAPTVSELTPEEAKNLLDGGDDGGGNPYARKQYTPRLSKTAKAILSHVEMGPTTIPEILEAVAIGMPSALGALAELERGAHIVQKGERYATTVDAARLSI